MKQYIFLLLFIGASCKPHVCPPVEKVITVTNTEYKPRVDTLVVIETTKRFPYPDTTSGFYTLGGSLETQPTELFKDGKRRDTIYKETWEYY